MNGTKRDHRSVEGGLSVRSKAWLTFAGIVIVSIFFALITTPKLPDSFPGSSFFSGFFPHLGLDLQGGTHLVYDVDLSGVPAEEHRSALEGARDVVERRVNTLGVAEPLVQSTYKGDSPRLIVELAGVQDVGEAIELIGETPLLEFKELGSDQSEPAVDAQAIGDIIESNRVQRERADELLSQIFDGASFEELARAHSEDVATKSDGGYLGWVTRGTFAEPFEKVLFDELEIDETASFVVETDFGFHVIQKTGERLNDSGDTEVESRHILLRTRAVDSDARNWINTELSGKHLQRAQVIFDQSTNSPQVSLVFNGEGADLFKDITERNVGRQVGIFLDGSSISAPVVQTAISGGQAVITGTFSLAEAKELAQRLNAGALPVPVALISQQTVGPSLGAESLNKSLTAAYIGLILVALFMVGYYLLPGLLSVVALAIYSVTTLALFELIPVTLTLAGIAGFILSVGMAVDANVLIFERIKEELRGKSDFTAAVEEGFRRAWPSIRDSNVSSLITVVILYWFGASMIKGFAITLGIGILVSMFSAITVTRTFLRLIVLTKVARRHWLFGIRVRKNENHSIH